MTTTPAPAPHKPSKKVKTKIALEHFGKIVAAAAIAVALKHVPDLGSVIPYGTYGILVTTAVLSGLEKYLTSGK